MSIFRPKGDCSEEQIIRCTENWYCKSIYACRELEKGTRNFLGCHIQTGNKNNFLSLDFDLQEFGVRDAKERLRGYRRYVYEAGAVDRSEIGKRRAIRETVVRKKRKKEFKISKIDRFRYRTRYFTDSGIIGSKEFVFANYQRMGVRIYCRLHELNLM